MVADLAWEILLGSTSRLAGWQQRDQAVKAQVVMESGKMLQQIQATGSSLVDSMAWSLGRAHERLVRSVV